jgi:hydrogenase maturation protease
MSEMERVFIGAVGYTNLRDLSVGLAVLEQLKRLEWPAGVEIDDLGPGGPIAAVHRFRDVPPYDRVILVGAVGRTRQPGQIYCYRWDGSLPDREEIQVRVAEGVTGVISLDNLLIVGGYFGIWPPDMVVVEIEPRDEDWGSEFSEPVQAAISLTIQVVQLAAIAPLEGLSTSPYTAWEVGFTTI